jgi:TRAP-type C4-dicarboxylate transport system permease small subunit
MNKWSEIILGLVLVIASIYIAFYSASWWGASWNFWAAAGQFFLGAVFWAIVGLGALFILLGISDLKN